MRNDGLPRFSQPKINFIYQNETHFIQDRCCHLTSCFLLIEPSCISDHCPQKISSLTDSGSGQLRSGLPSSSSANPSRGDASPPVISRDAASPFSLFAHAQPSPPVGEASSPFNLFAQSQGSFFSCTTSVQQPSLQSCLGLFMFHVSS